MKTKKAISLADKVLLAVYRTSGGTTRRVNFEEIVLQAWKDFPADFSLLNHPEFPDASIAYQRIYANLTAKRLLVPLRKQVLRLTDKGLDRAQAIENNLDDQENSKHRIQLSREAKQFLDHALKTRAYLTWKNDRGDQLIDYDARVFFQFSTGTPIRDRKRRLGNAREAIEKAIAMGLPDGDTLRDLLEFLVSRFPELFTEK